MQENRIKNWQRFVPRDERNIAPDRLIEFARMTQRYNLFTPALIADSAEAMKKRTGKYPHAKSGIIIDGPLANGVNDWGDVDDSIRKKWRGLSHENCPYDSLPDLLCGEADKIRKIDYTLENITASATATKLATGEYPTAESGLIKYGTLADGVTTWKGVDHAMFSKNRGLTEKNCPYSHLTDLFIAKGFINSKAEISVNAIACCAYDHFINTGKWPIVDEGLVLYGPLADGKTTWKAIDLAIKTKLRGLTIDNCPYNSTLALLIGEGLREVTILADLSVNIIAMSSYDTWTRTRRCPEVKDGLILYGPAADGVTTWSMAGSAIKKKLRGLTSENCPYVSLSHLQVGENLKTLRFQKPKWAQDLILQPAA